MAQRNTVEIYDLAVMKFFKEHVKIPVRMYESEGIGFHSSRNAVDLTTQFRFATPERPFGLPHDKDGKIVVKDQEIDRASTTLPTPIVTLIRSSMQFDPRRNNTNRARKVGKWGDDNAYWVESDFPRPWNIQYQLDMFGRYRQDINWLSNWFLMHPNPVQVMSMDFGYPWGIQTASMIFSGTIDNSDIETNENERWIRVTVPFYIEAWMFESYTDISDIQSVAEINGCNGNPATSIIPSTRRRRSVKEFDIKIWDWKGTEINDGDDVLLDTIEVKSV